MAVNEARHAGDIEAEVDAAYHLSLFRIESRDWRLLESLVEEFIGVNRTDKERFYAAHWLMEIQEFIIEEGQAALAEQLMYQVVKIGQDIERSDVEFAGRVHLATAQRAQGNSRDAIANYEAALEMLGLDPEADEYRAELSMRLGQANLELNRVEQARLYFNRALTIASQYEDQRARSTLLGWLGLTNMQANNFEGAVSQLEPAVKGIRTEGDEDLWPFLAILLANLSDAYKGVGKPEDQRRAMAQARDMFYKTNQNDAAQEAERAIKQMDARRSAF